MTHDEARELLAALALDAVDGEERSLLEEHVAQCPRCQSELDGYREVAGALGNLVDPLPEELWSSISRRMYEVGDESVPSLAAPVAATGVGVAAPRGHDALRRRMRWAAPLAAAAAVVAVLAVQLASADHRIANLQSSLGAREVRAALHAPGHRLVDLSNASSRELAEFVVVPDGRGYLVNSHLATLPSRETYQLWGIVNGRAISLGLMGSSPRHVTFTMSGSSKFATLAVTVEPAGGSVTPTQPIVAAGPV
ncbi:MAG: anti-sigma factor domain-containing protein [Acidimicrobiales bacterium]